MLTPLKCISIGTQFHTQQCASVRKFTTLLCYNIVSIVYLQHGGAADRITSPSPIFCSAFYLLLVSFFAFPFFLRVFVFSHIRRTTLPHQLLKVGYAFLLFTVVKAIFTFCVFYIWCRLYSSILICV